MHSDTNPLAQTTRLGATGPQTAAIGLGCMGMSGVYGATDDDESVATIQAAVDAGVTLIDTGDFYGAGHNEMLVGRALKGARRQQAILSVKFGGQMGPDMKFIGFDTSRVAVRASVAYSLKRLGVDVIDIYRPARLDPRVPIEDTIGSLAELVQEGFIKHIALSEMSAETVRRAAAVHPIVDLQIEHGLVTRGAEATIFPTLRELGISATLYGVYSRGLLTGSTGKADFRAHLPRFVADNSAVVDEVARFAKARGLTPAQLLLAWSRAKTPGFVPVVGIKTRAQLKDTLDGLATSLSAEDVTALEVLAAGGVQGTRYDAHQMAMLDSER